MTSSFDSELVYVCSPYAEYDGHTIQENIEKAKVYCRAVAKCGYIPFASHLLYTSIYDDSIPEERAYGIELGIKMLDRCDMVWVFGDYISSGMKQEIGYAIKKGIPILYVKDTANEVSAAV